MPLRCLKTGGWGNNSGRGLLAEGWAEFKDSISGEKLLLLAMVAQHVQRKMAWRAPGESTDLL